MPSRWRVPAGYACFLAVLALARPNARSLFIAFPPALAGEAIRIWASGHIEKTETLATGGPYAHSRNPLYVGSLLLGIAVGLAAGSLWAVGVIVAYFAAFYPAVMKEEAAFLRRKFPQEYAAWAKSVPLLLPRPLPAGPRLSVFRWVRVRRNREWRTLLALPAVVALLFARARLLP